MVAVTGIGVVSPHGDHPDAMFAALMRGESAIGEFIGDFPNAKPAAVASVAFDAGAWFTPLQLAGVDRVSQLAVAAAISLFAPRFCSSKRASNSPSRRSNWPPGPTVMSQPPPVPACATAACRR